MLMKTSPVQPPVPPLLALSAATLQLGGGLQAGATSAGALCFGPFDLCIEAGERVAILGPSGAGKSTLMKLMAREWTPGTGQIAFKGRAYRSWSLPELSRQRAVLPQSNGVAFGLPGELVIRLGRVACETDPQQDAIVQQAAQMTQADHLLHQRFDTLSGGEQARVQLARVLAQLWDMREGLVLVDEPLAALDPGLQIELQAALDRYCRERGHAMVAIVHDMNHALAGFDRMLLVKDGMLQHDLPTGVAAVPALEALFGIGIDCFYHRDGALVVVPRRRLPVHADVGQSVGVAS